MDTPESRPADPLFLLLSWFSPACPVGSYAYSHGLEKAVDIELIANAEDLQEWIETVLLLGSGRTDGVIFRETHDAARQSDGHRLQELATLSRAMQSTGELALESMSQGEAFLRAIGSAWPSDGLEHLDPRTTTFPVAVAAACAVHRVSLETALLSWYHAFASNLVSAGVRLVPLGQTEGLQTLAALAKTVQRASKLAQELQMEDIGTAAPFLDILSIQHETQYTRLFRS